jgi:selenocysteine lyase/cysteine desulfurase
MSMETAQAVFNSRVKCADLFGAQPENTIFTLNCTHALNLAIKGILTPGAHILTSDIEHNAVIRPVHAASKENGINYTVVHTTLDDDETVRNFEHAINRKTRALVCTCASNVTGRILPYKKLGDLCRRHGICFIIDAAQGAGVLPISLIDGVNIICAAGHKGLYGPMGTGLMITDGRYRLRTIIEGGTGSRSREIEQPEELPDRFESGTINTPGVIGMGAGVDFVRSKTIERIYRHESSLCEFFYEEMKKIPDVTLYTSDFGANRAPLVPFNIGDFDSSTAAGRLSRFGFYLRGGLHCAHLAHKKMGTLERGCVRFAPSAFNTKQEVIQFVSAVRKLAAE